MSGSGASERCNINKEKGCPVASTCGIYIGLTLVQGKNGLVDECNRYDFYTMPRKEYLKKWESKRF